MRFGKQLNLFLVDGTPGGLLTAEVGGWTGHITAAPRSHMKHLLQREEASRTGVYILLGEDPSAPEGVRAYIGEGDELRTRIRSHAQPLEQGGKEFWDRVILMTSKDANLTKAHVLYLEARLIEIAKVAQRSEIDNAQAPDRKHRLPEADIAVMEAYLAELETVLPMLGVNIFRQPAARSDSPKLEPVGAANSDPVTFYLTHGPSGRVARAQEHDGQFTVLRGSQAATVWTGTEHSYSKLLESLHSDGTLEPHPSQEHSTFTRDRVMNSVSAAAAVILGRTANGRTDWKEEKTGMTYSDWQNQNLDEV
jgi:hypothetical protein